MSKKSKKASKEKNMQRKRAAKAANKAKYQAMALAGQNTKSKRARGSNKNNKKVNLIDHKDGHCGNVACKRCFPNFSTPATRGEIAIYNKRVA